MVECACYWWPVSCDVNRRFLLEDLQSPRTSSSFPNLAGNPAVGHPVTFLDSSSSPRDISPFSPNRLFSVIATDMTSPTGEGDATVCGVPHLWNVTCSRLGSPGEEVRLHGPIKASRWFSRTSVIREGAIGATMSVGASLCGLWGGESGASNRLSAPAICTWLTYGKLFFSCLARLVQAMEFRFRKGF